MKSISRIINYQVVALLVMASLISACSKGSSDAPAATKAAPVLAAAADVALAYNQTLRVAPVNTGGDVDSWSVTPSLPAWMSFDSASGILSGNPGQSNIGSTPGIIITATNESGSADYGPFSVTVTDLPLAAPSIQTQIVNNRLIRYTGSSDEFTLVNSGGIADSWTISGNFPDAGSGWLDIGTDLFGTPSGMVIYPDIPHLGVFDVTVTASNSAGSSSLTFELEIKLSLPRFNLRGNVNEMAVYWTQPVDPPSGPISFDLYIAKQADIDPATFNDANGDRYIGYTSNTAITTFNGAPLKVGDEYHLLMVANYNATDSTASDDMRLNITALNDTGIGYCNTGTALRPAPCAPVDYPYPGQDAEAGMDRVIGLYLEHYLTPRFTRLNSAREPVTQLVAIDCVRDNTTGLLWEFQPQAVVNATALADHVTAVNSATKCGLSNWRVPTLEELLSIVNFGSTSSTLPRTYGLGPAMANATYWSNDTVDATAVPPLTWGIDFRSGASTSFDATTAVNDLVLVSGATRLPALVDNNDGTVTDTSSGLIWKKCAEGYLYNAGVCDVDTGSGDVFTWQAALQRAAAVNAGSVGENLGGGDWRVPNIKEINSLLNRQVGLNAMFAADQLPLPTLNTFWTNSPVVGPTNPSVNFAWSQNLADTGALMSENITATQGVERSIRLVRGALPQGVQRWYRDADADSYGTPSDFLDAVDRPEGYVLTYWREWDCDDSDASILPYADEFLDDNIDNNCNGVIDEEMFIGE